MSEEITPRRRGRPRKSMEDNPADLQDVKDTQIADLQDEIKAMQEQNKYMMAAFMKMVGRDGISDIPKPPSEDTVVLDSDAEYDIPRDATGRPKPGSLLGDPRKERNVGWIPWRKDDLDPDDYVDFVPAPIPSLIFPITDDEGRQKIRLDVNDLVCWLTVGVPNRVNRLFHNVYTNSYDTWRELENFKRKGPSVAPWGNTGPDGRPSWYYEPSALSFGMDENGHALTPFRSNPLRTYQAETPEAI